MSSAELNSAAKKAKEVLKETLKSMCLDHDGLFMVWLRPWRNLERICLKECKL